MIARKENAQVRCTAIVAPTVTPSLAGAIDGGRTLLAAYDSLAVGRVDSVGDGRSRKAPARCLEARGGTHSYVAAAAVSFVALTCCGGQHERRARPVGARSDLRVRVLARDGQPSPYPVALVTERGGAAVSQHVGDAAGQLVVPNLAQGQLVTLASADGWAIVGRDAVLSDSTIGLDRPCLSLAGQATGDLTPGGIIWAQAEGSQYPFGALVRHDGTYQFCLEPGTYFVAPDSPLVAPPAIVRLPAEVEVAAFTEASINHEAPSVDVPLAPSLRSLIAREVDVVGIGEPNHGSAEALLQRWRQCASELAVKTVAIEAGVAEVFPLDDYVRGAGGDDDARRAVAALGYWTWDTEEFLAVLQEMRRYNSSRAVAEQLAVVGIDVQGVKGARAYLGAHADESLQELARDLGGAVTLSDLERLGRATRAKARARVEHHLARQALSVRVEMVLRSIRSQLDQADAAGAAQDIERDAGMAELVLAHLKRVGGRTCVWAHNAHVQTDASTGVAAMGVHLRAELGTRYVAVGLLNGRGSVLAWDTAHQIGVVSHDVAPRSGSLEERLAARVSSGAHFFRTDDVDAMLRAWLAQYHAIGEFGAVFPAVGRARQRRLSRAFDVIGYLAEVTPSTPTITGVRKAP